MKENNWWNMKENNWRSSSNNDTSFYVCIVYVCVETEDMKKYDLLTHNTQ